jgi:hypothetical protein
MEKNHLLFSCGSSTLRVRRHEDKGRQIKNEKSCGLTPHSRRMALIINGGCIGFRVRLDAPSSALPTHQCSRMLANLTTRWQPHLPAMPSTSLQFNGLEG